MIPGTLALAAIASLTLLDAPLEHAVSARDAQTLRCIAAIDVVAGWGIDDPVLRAGAREQLVRQLESGNAITQLETHAMQLQGDELQKALDDCQTMSAVQRKPG